MRLVFKSNGYFENLENLDHLTMIKLFIRRLLAALLFYSGFNALYRWIIRRRHAVILMYHRVLDDADKHGSYIQPGMYVTTDTFEMQMRYLKKRYRVTSLTELIATLKNQRGNSKNTCVITFDDGWHDTYIHAFPILKKYDLPASVFLVSEYVDTDRLFWPDRLSHLLTRYLAQPQTTKSMICSALERAGILNMLIDAEQSQAEKIDMIIEKMKDFEAAERETVLLELEERLQASLADKSYRQMLSWNEIKEMARSRISFGSHGKSHAILTKIPKAEAAREIVESQATINKHLTTPCSAFCYPNGDYNEEIKEIVRRHYTCALTTQNGAVKPGDGLFALKRIGIHDDMTSTKALFACRISGLLGKLGLE